MPRTHSREHFYKFMPAETALAVLRSSSLRYSAPSRFNDPFDHQVSFLFPFTEQEFSVALIGEISRIVYDDSVEIPNPTLFGQATLMLRGSRDKVSRDQLLSELFLGAVESGQLFKDNEKEFNDLLTAHLANSRVLCVTEELDNVVMRAHYAAEHKGVCIRLQCIDEVDNTLLVARPVKYTDVYPEFPPLRDYIRHLTGEAPIDFAPLVYDEAAYVKHKNWGYEREWRIHVPQIHEPPRLGYSDWKENPRVFGALYLGCRISVQDAQALIRVVETQMPHMEIYQVAPSRKYFGMEYQRLR